MKVRRENQNLRVDGEKLQILLFEDSLNRHEIDQHILVQPGPTAQDREQTSFWVQASGQSSPDAVCERCKVKHQLCQRFRTIVRNV